jgi:hypothetical protein
MTNYRVVSELRTHGQLIDIPDSAEDVSVEPTDSNGLVRVTYLRRMQEVPFVADDEEPRPISH